MATRTRKHDHASRTGAKPGSGWLLFGLVLVTLTLGKSALAADISFSASVDQTEVGLNETLALTLTINADTEIPTRAVKLKDTGTLRIVSTSTRESVSFSFAAGKQSFNKIRKLIYILEPTRLGKTSIGSAKLRFRGKTYKTRPIEVTVVKQSKRPATRRPGPTSPLRRSPFGLDDDWDDFFQSPFDRGRRHRPQIDADDIFVRASASPDVVVEGQQTTVTLRIYSTVGARIATIRWPKLDAFFSVDRDVSKATVDQKYVNGELYRYKILDRRALFPLRPGKIEIGPIEVEVEISTSPFFPPQVRTLRTQKLQVKVMELPAEGRPEAFRPANVGQFSMSAEVDGNEVSLNQPVTYTLTLRGTGSIQRVRPPELPALPRFKAFDPNVDVRVQKRGREVRGSKTFEYILVPLASGELEIPALTFSYYDPRSGRYRSLQTEAQLIKVSASDDSANGAVAGPSAGHEVNILAGAFKPIRYKSSLSGYGPPFYKNSFFIPLLIIPPFFYVMVVLIGLVRARGRADSRRNRMRRAWARGQKRLKKAAQLAAGGQAAEFYAELKAALMDGIEARTGIVPHGITLAELVCRLEQLGISNGVIEALSEEAENCDFGRFAPATTRGEQMMTSLQRVRKVFKVLDKERVKPAGEAGRQ